MCCFFFQNKDGDDVQNDGTTPDTAKSSTKKIKMVEFLFFFCRFIYIDYIVIVNLYSCRKSSEEQSTRSGKRLFSVICLSLLHLNKASVVSLQCLMKCRHDFLLCLIPACLRIFNFQWCWFMKLFTFFATHCSILSTLICVVYNALCDVLLVWRN